MFLAKERQRQKGVVVVQRKLGTFFDELEIMPPREREKYFTQKLAESINYGYQNAPLVREIFDRAGVSPSDIKTAKDLEKIPITRKTDLIELQRLKPPYGGFLTISPEDIGEIFISPGPIYEPQFGPYGKGKVSWFVKAFHAAGFRRGDTVVNTFTYHMSPAGICIHQGLEECGATVIPTGVGNTETQVQTMRDLKVTGFVGTPSFLMTLIERAESMGYDFRRDFTLQRAWFIGEMLPASLRKSFEEDYGISTSQAYGTTEVGGTFAYECSQKCGMHMSEGYILEIVNPETGKQLGPGEVGEIVVTPLFPFNKAYSLIRFGTGDMSYYTDEPCACSRTSNRLVAIVGRTGDAIKVRGMFIVAKQAEQVFASFDQISNFQIVVSRKEQRDEMIFNIELGEETIDKSILANDLNKKFQELCRVKADKIEFVPEGTIPEKHETILDTRTWD